MKRKKEVNSVHTGDIGISHSEWGKGHLRGHLLTRVAELVEQGIPHLAGLKFETPCMLSRSSSSHRALPSAVYLSYVVCRLLHWSGVYPVRTQRVAAWHSIVTKWRLLIVFYPQGAILTAENLIKRSYICWIMLMCKCLRKDVDRLLLHFQVRPNCCG